MAIWPQAWLAFVEVWKQFPNLTVVVGRNEKEDDDWLVVACGTDQERPVDLPTSFNGVQVEYVSAGPARVLDQDAWQAVHDAYFGLVKQGAILSCAPEPEKTLAVFWVPVDAVGVNYPEEVSGVKILLNWLPRPSESARAHLLGGNHGD